MQSKDHSCIDTSLVLSTAGVPAMSYGSAPSNTLVSQGSGLQSNMSAQIIEIDKNLDRDESMLPVHFLPEGRQCYDWINKDLKVQSTGAKTKLHNSITYTSASLNNESAKNHVNSLLSAAENNKIETLKDILNTHPLVINLTDSDGYTALHRACYSGHIDIVEYLLAHGANINAKTHDGWQPIHCATRWNHVDVTHFLLKHEADVNSKTNGSQTALHFAALSEDNITLLELLLLQPDVDLSIKNGAGDLAYDLAKRSGPQVKLFEMRDEAMNI